MVRCVWPLVVLALASGCYLRHGEEEPTAARAEDASLPPTPRPTPARPDAEAPTPTPVPPPIPDAGIEVDVPATCEGLCEAWDANGCGSDGCLDSCLSRAEVAAEIGCLAEWKFLQDCVTEHPCDRDFGCPEMSGWPACLASGRRP